MTIEILKKRHLCIALKTTLQYIIPLTVERMLGGKHNFNFTLIEQNNRENNFIIMTPLIFQRSNRLTK